MPSQDTMETCKHEAKRRLGGRGHGKLNAVQLAHVVSYLRDVFLALIDGLIGKRQELADGATQAIYAMDNGLELLPVL